LKRQHGEKKKYPLKVDAAVRTRNTLAQELVVMESSQYDSLDGQTKFLSDRYKLARELKDQLDYIYAKLPNKHKGRIVDIDVFGVLASGEYTSWWTLCKKDMI
jgi:hypothetical protein